MVFNRRLGGQVLQWNALRHTDIQKEGMEVYAVEGRRGVDDSAFVRRRDF
ncbi:hypothetical protein HORIV_66120 [Vreelandella olivaria]|uniref:Uncharacterized protein n=1 Tax=Vreelandella olivaria TaxID=390919 RepID=A0ABN5X4S5_9GAMM|nr:hypothetical protein HORIV_66120 [Halomonas olivaria]